MKTLENPNLGAMLDEASHAAPHWLSANLPSILMEKGPMALFWWQWVFIPLLLIITGILGLLLAKVILTIINNITKRTVQTWDDVLAARLNGPIRLASWLILFSIGIRFVGLNQNFSKSLNVIIGSIALLTLFWGILRFIDIFGHALLNSNWAVTNPVSKSILPLLIRLSKVALIIISGITVLSYWDYPVASLLAGLGIGGLALALAAQKTVENLFGSLTIGVDQPCREGDFVKIEDFVGTVEAIGLRSTRIRTLDRTIIAMPNGKLADMRIESFTARDRFRLACKIGLVYSTTASQMREVLNGFENLLRSHPKIWPDAVTVRFTGLGSYSLDIDIMAWFNAIDWAEFQTIRQDVLIDFMGVVERAQTSFALPTQTIQLEKP